MSQHFIDTNKPDVVLYLLFTFSPGTNQQDQIRPDWQSENHQLSILETPNMKKAVRLRIIDGHKLLSGKTEPPSVSLVWNKQKVSTENRTAGQFPDKQTIFTKATKICFLNWSFLQTDGELRITTGLVTMTMMKSDRTAETAAGRTEFSQRDVRADWERLPMGYLCQTLHRS